MTRIRPARAEEAPLLSALALASKASWGYDDALLERCRAELTLDPTRLFEWRAHVVEDGGEVKGFFTVRGIPPEGELADLFVAPSAMGRGVGSALLNAARALAIRLGFRALLIHSDPYAESFYLRQGAVRIGETPSGSIPGRVLPLLRLSL